MATSKVPAIRFSSQTLSVPLQIDHISKNPGSNQIPNSQTYSGTLIDSLIQAAIKCEYESPESRLGAGDGGDPCGRDAVVTNLADELRYCAQHAQIARTL